MDRVCRLLLVSVSLMLGGCSLFGDQPSAEQTRMERLKLPPDLVLQHDSQTPDGADTSGTTALDGDQRLLPQVADVEVRAAGGDRWLLVDEPPQRVWERVEAYLKDRGVEVARRDPAAGVLETDWIYSRQPLTGGVFAPTVAGPDTARVADRYLVRLERGREAGTTEVFVAHRRAARDAAGTWTLRESDPFLQVELLRGLMVAFGQSADTAATELAVAAGEPRATVSRNDAGQPVLRLDSEFFEAWRRVGLALDRAGFTVSDRDRSARVYFVRYDRRAEEGPEEKGFLRSLAFWSESTPDTVHRYRLTLTQESSGTTQVEVRTEDGEPAPSELAARMLGLLEAQLR